MQSIAHIPDEHLPPVHPHILFEKRSALLMAPLFVCTSPTKQFLPRAILSSCLSAGTNCSGEICCLALKLQQQQQQQKSSHQLNNMSNVWVKIHCNGDGKQQHSFKHWQESCTLPGTQDGHRGLFWGHVTGRISPSQEGFPISESQAWISATTHKLCLRDELFVTSNQLHLGAVSTIPRHSQGTTKPH